VIIRSYHWRRCVSSPNGITLIIARGKESSHAQTSAQDRSPPPPAALSPQLTLPQIWATRPAASRRQTLQTLSRIVAQQLHILRSPQEVSQEDG
jgi:hypothetical protein